LTIDQKKVMIPFIGIFIKEVKDDKIIISPIEGLL
jgi:ribosomal 30S subunit maturation factor RimM